MKYSKRTAILIAIAMLGLTHCSQDVSGEFAWNSFYDQDIPPLERSLLQPTQFRFGRNNLYFSDQNTIWWMYRIDNIGFGTRSLLAALYSVSGSPAPVEIDLRSIRIESSAETKTKLLRQYYNPLPVGDYRLKIALEETSTPVDEVDFSVITDEELNLSQGPLRGDEYRDFFSEAGEDDLTTYSRPQ